MLSGGAQPGDHCPFSKCGAASASRSTFPSRSEAGSDAPNPAGGRTGTPLCYSVQLGLGRQVVSQSPDLELTASTFPMELLPPQWILLVASKTTGRGTCGPHDSKCRSSRRPRPTVFGRMPRVRSESGRDRSGSRLVDN